jgi:hypothetical protein
VSAPGLRLEPLATLTRRPLPIDDPAIDALAPDARAVLARAWQGRAEAEARAAATFGYVVEILEALGAAAPLVGLARRAIHDETRHAEICARVAARYGDRALEVPPPAARGATPDHPDVDPTARRALHVLGQCACNETVAVAFLEAGRAAATADLPREASRELLADDVDHARLGWAFLATLDARARAAIAPHLPRLCRHNLIAWRRRRTFPAGAEARGHGLLPWGEVDRIVLEATRDRSCRASPPRGSTSRPPRRGSRTNGR